MKVKKIVGNRKLLNIKERDMTKLNNWKHNYLKVESKVFSVAQTVETSCGAYVRIRGGSGDRSEIW